MEAAGLKRNETDVLIGGPPCQPFSKSGFWVNGDSGRLNDPRSFTLNAYLQILKEVRPKAFLIENVEGFNFREKNEGVQLVSNALDSINRDCKTNYKASVQVLNAADYGVPQLRRRLFIVGSRDGKPFVFPKPTHGIDRKPYVSAWEALRTLPMQVDPQLSAKGKWAHLLPSIPEGENYLWHTERGGGLPLFGWRTRYWTFLLKLAKDKPSWTIQAQPGPATGPFHWDNRRLSPQELARLQTFPDTFKPPLDLQTAQRQIGNAVPSLLAEILAREIATQLIGRNITTCSPELRITRSKTPAPKPKKPLPVHSRYLSLAGNHDPHPGKGLGPRSVQDIVKVA